MEACVRQGEVFFGECYSGYIVSIVEALHEFPYHTIERI